MKLDLVTNECTIKSCINNRLNFAEIFNLQTWCTNHIRENSAFIGVGGSILKSIIL